MPSTPLNTPVRANTHWVARHLREAGLNAEVTAEIEQTTDGEILIRKDAAGELSVQVGDSYVCLTSWDNVQKHSLYHGEYATIEELAAAIRRRLA